MENTPNYNLNLPDYEDFADVEKLNENFEIIDTQMKTTEDALTTHLDNDVHIGKNHKIAVRGWVMQSIAHDIDTIVTFNSPANNYFIDGTTLKVKEAGSYLVYSRIGFNAEPTGARVSTILVNSTLSNIHGIANGGLNIGYDNTLYAIGLLTLMSNDLLTVSVKQLSGTALGIYSREFGIVRVA